MPAEPWLSVLLGVGLGSLHGLTGRLVNRIARRYDDARFLRVALGGLVVRLMLVLMLFAIVLAAFPVRRLPLAGAFLLTVFAGLAAEVRSVHRHAGARMRSASGPGDAV